MYQSEKKKYDDKKIKFPTRLQNSADNLSKQIAEDEDKLGKLTKRLMEASEIGSKFTEMHDKLKHATTDVESLVSLSTKSPSSIKTQDSLQNMLSELNVSSHQESCNRTNDCFTYYIWSNYVILYGLFLIWVSFC